MGVRKEDELSQHYQRPVWVLALLQRRIGVSLENKKHTQIYGVKKYWGPKTHVAVTKHSKNSRESGWQELGTITYSFFQKMKNSSTYVHSPDKPMLWSFSTLQWSSLHWETSQWPSNVWSHCITLLVPPKRNTTRKQGFTCTCHFPLLYQPCI